MRNYDVVIIGGGPAGYTTAITLKRLNPEKSVALIRREERVLIPCAIPYLFYSIDSIDKNILPDAPLHKLGIELFIDEVRSVDLDKRIVKTQRSGEIGFKRLVLATGSKPVRLGIKGGDLKNVFYIIKEYSYMKEMVDSIRSATDIVIVGGGFVGVEIADELAKAGKNVTIVEILPHCLLKNFDEEFATIAEEELRSRGVKIKTNASVVSIEGSGKVEKVKLSTGEELSADAVIVSVGVKPNADLAKDMGLKLGSLGGIWVDDCRRTSNPLVFAVGDCIERRDIITSRPTVVQLASAATTDARIVALNLFANGVPCRHAGSIGLFSTKIGDTVFACAGITESRARREELDYVVGTGEAVDRHPGVLAGAKKIKLKLLFSRATHEIIGAQVAGGPSVAEFINLIGMLIRQRVRILDILSLQVATHPWLTPSPVAYTLYAAALDAFAKLKK